MLPELIESGDDAKQAGRTFVARVQTGDFAAMRAEAAPGARIDEAYLLQFVRFSTGFEGDDYARGFDDTACWRGFVTPQRMQLLLYLTKPDAFWRVTRAGPSDPECEERLQD